MPTPEEIQTCINNLTASSEITEMVVLAAETNDVTVNRSIPVADTNNLPDLATSGISVGTVFFVQSLCIPVVAGLNSWMTLDNRVIRKDFTYSDMWAWGLNTSGQLGDDTVINKSSPVSVVGGFTNWCQVSSSFKFSLALRTTGTAWAWGCNNSGQLGDNTVISKSSPVSVIGGFTNWCNISAGSYHSLGVRQNGTIYAWGANNRGQLGDCTTVVKSSPISVVGGFTDWCQVSAGGNFSLALRTNGTAWSWGYNTFASLGDCTTANKSSPVSVVGGFTDWCQISAGGGQGLAVRTNGTAWAWGFNNYGQLGDCTIVAKSSPVSVVGGFTDWCQVSGSGNRSHSLAVRTNGTAWAWGYNGGSGKLGDNTTTTRSSPVSVVGGFTNWCQVSAGGCHSIALRLNGTAWAWGNGIFGQLGDCTTVAKSSPISVVGGFTDWCQVSGGDSQSLGIRKS